MRFDYFWLHRPGRPMSVLTHSATQAGPSSGFRREWRNTGWNHLQPDPGRCGARAHTCIRYRRQRKLSLLGASRFEALHSRQTGDRTASSACRVRARNAVCGMAQGARRRRADVDSVVNGRTLMPNLHNATTNELIEAKSSTGQTFVRTAIGQVRDYQHCAAKQGIEASPALLPAGSVLRPGWTTQGAGDLGLCADREDVQDDVAVTYAQTPVTPHLQSARTPIPFVASVTACPPGVHVFSENSVFRIYRMSRHSTLIEQRRNACTSHLSCREPNRLSAGAIAFEGRPTSPKTETRAAGSRHSHVFGLPSSVQVAGACQNLAGISFANAGTRPASDEFGTSETLRSAGPHRR